MTCTGCRKRESTAEQRSNLQGKFILEPLEDEPDESLGLIPTHPGLIVSDAFEREADRWEAGNGKEMQ